MSDVEGFEGDNTFGWRRGVSRGMSRGRGSRVEGYVERWTSRGRALTASRGQALTSIEGLRG